VAGRCARLAAAAPSAASAATATRPHSRSARTRARATREQRWEGSAWISATTQKIDRRATRTKAHAHATSVGPQSSVLSPRFTSFPSPPTRPYTHRVCTAACVAASAAHAVLRGAAGARGARWQHARIARARAAATPAGAAAPRLARRRSCRAVGRRHLRHRPGHHQQRRGDCGGWARCHRTGRGGPPHNALRGGLPALRRVGCERRGSRQGVPR
jgi:hypothetical protein